MTPQKLGPAEQFYADALRVLADNTIPFLIGGTYALNEYTGIHRETKDIDIFCKASDYPKIITVFKEKGFKTKVDDRWLAKIYSGKYFIDIIFSTVTGVCTVDDTWFEHAPTVKIYD